MKNIKNLFIIIEGCDNSGKTTLINNLKNYYNNLTLQSLHFSNVKQETPEDTIKYNTKLYTEMFETLAFISTSDYSGAICDRSHLGELVYGKMYRGYTGNYVLDIEKQFENYNFFDDLFLITLVDSPERLIQRDDGLSISIDPENKRKEINLFRAASVISNIKNKLIIDISDKDAEMVKSEVIQFIDSRY